MTTALGIILAILLAIGVAAMSWSRMRGAERRADRRRAAGGTGQQLASRRHFQGFDERGTVPRHERHNPPEAGPTTP